MMENQSKKVENQEKQLKKAENQSELDQNGRNFELDALQWSDRPEKKFLPQKFFEKKNSKIFFENFWKFLKKFF